MSEGVGVSMGGGKHERRCGRKHESKRAFERDFASSSYENLEISSSNEGCMPKNNRLRAVLRGYFASERPGGHGNS